MRTRKKTKRIFQRQINQIDHYFSELFRGCQRCIISAQLPLTNLLIFWNIFTIGEIHHLSFRAIHRSNLKRNKYLFSTSSINFAIIQLDEFLFWLAIAIKTFYHILAQPHRMLTAVDAMNKVRILPGFLAIKQLFHEKLSTFLLKTIFQNSDLHVQAFPANYHHEQNNFLARIRAG